MGFFSDFSKFLFTKWIENAPDEDLENGYKKEGKNGSKPDLVKMLSKHMK